MEVTTKFEIWQKVYFVKGVYDSGATIMEGKIKSIIVEKEKELTQIKYEINDSHESDGYLFFNRPFPEVREEFISESKETLKEQVVSFVKNNME